MGIPLRVLIVEDSEDDALMLVRELKRAGYEPTFERVETRKAMGAALDKEQWDIMLVDYNLPRFGGLAALKLLQEKGLDLPAIIVSGAIGEDVAVEAMKAGAYDYVMKGNLKRLIPAIEREIGEAIERQRRREAERSLADMYATYRTIVESIRDGLTIAEGETVSYVNDRACQIFGYPREELMKLTTVDLAAPEEKERLRKIREETERSNILPENLEFWAIRQDGSRHCVSNRYSLIQKGDKPSGYLVVTTDITELKNMQAQLMAQDRLASLGELVSGVAHELNNPLTSVIGFSELLLRRDLPDDIKEDLEIINDKAKLIASIVQSLLTFARKQPQEKLPIDLNERIRRVLELRAYEQKTNNIQVITRFASDLPQIMGDSFQLYQVFLNIIINAEFFMIEAHNKGTLTITTERMIGDFVRATFADDGPGISKENMTHLFTPFFTTKEVGKGTGLGLSICHGIITEHEGRIYAGSELGKGATLIVELPITSSNESRIGR
jgi:PAS domain S-box-containing protein